MCQASTEGRCVCRYHTHGTAKVKKLCSHGGMYRTNGAVKGGVCKTHGAKVTRKRCSILRDDTKHAQEGMEFVSRMAPGLKKTMRPALKVV
jgi:hypothetical protein